MLMVKPGREGRVPGSARVNKIQLKNKFMDLGHNTGPGRLPLDSGRRDVAFAGVFASVAPLAVSFVSECI